MSKSPPSVFYALNDAVATLTLNRPEQLNALTPEMLASARALLERAVRDGARAVLITGAGRAFCSGASLSGEDEPGAIGPDLGEIADAFYNPLVKTIVDLPIPVVTAVNGVAAGAGAALALWGDIIVAARSASFMLAFSNVGLVPDSAATWLVANSAGRVKALEMALLGERMYAEEARTAGLVTRVTEDESLGAVATEIASTLAARPTLALGLIRRQIRIALDDGLDATIEAETQHQRQAGYSLDHQEGLSAFREKRSPRFVGS